jgi:NTP pyrophosphatase (non-canonical NTP hydrolase)
MNKKINQLRDEIHANAVGKGFYEDEIRTMIRCYHSDEKALEHAFFAQRIALIHSELIEAIEADRKNKYANIEEFETRLEDCEGYSQKELDMMYKFDFIELVGNSVEDELADVIIRTLDLCGHLNIDIEKHVELKMKYNQLREYKHNKNY